MIATPSATRRVHAADRRRRAASDIAPTNEAVLIHAGGGTRARIRYSPGLRDGRVIHVSGHIGRSAERELSPDAQAQVRAAFRGVGRTLEGLGGSWADVVEITTYDVGLREQVEWLLDVQAEFVAQPYPAWTAVGVSELFSPHAVFEISATAVLAE